MKKECKCCGHKIEDYDCPCFHEGWEIGNSEPPLREQKDYENIDKYEVKKKPLRYEGKGMKNLIRQIRLFIFVELVNLAMRILPTDRIKTLTWLAQMPFED